MGFPRGTQPHARCGTFRRAFPAEGPGGIAEPAQARRKPVAGGVQGSGLPGSARAGPSQPRCRGELGARRGRSRRLRPLRAPGAGRYAMDSANEPSLLMWCLSGALPALTTIMSMPSKRTGTSALGGVALQPSGCQQLELLAGEVPLAEAALLAVGRGDVDEDDGVLVHGHQIQAARHALAAPVPVQDLVALALHESDGCLDRALVQVLHK